MKKERVKNTVEFVEKLKKAFKNSYCKSCKGKDHCPKSVSELADCIARVISLSGKTIQIIPQKIEEIGREVEIPV